MEESEGAEAWDRLCVICSLSCGPQLPSVRQCLLNHHSFSRFCGELEVCGTDDREETEDFAHRFVAQQFLKSLDRSADKLSVCSECIVLVTSAMEQKAAVEEAECHLLKLQMEVLTKLKVLQQCADLYLTEMRKIFEKTKVSDLEGIMEMEDDLSGTTNYRKGKWKRFRNRCNVMLFREKIMDVVTYLALFRDDLGEKLGDVKPLNPPSEFDLGLTRNNTAVTVPDSMSSPTAFEMYPDDYGDYDDNLIKYFQTEEAPANIPFPPEEEKSDEMDGVESEGAVKTEIEEINRDDGDFGENDLQEDETFEDEDYNATKKGSKALGRPKKIPIGGKVRSKKTSNNSVAGKKRKTEPASSSASEKVFPQKEKLCPVDVTKMTPIKACLLGRIVRRPPCDLVPLQMEGWSGPQTFENLGKMDFKDAWGYDPSTEKVTLAGLEILVGESNSPPTLTLTCRLCSFHASVDSAVAADVGKQILYDKISELQRKLFNHVFLEHLNAFGCPHCHHQSVTLRTYKHHLVIHQEPDRARCSCGKVFKHYHSLYRHKRMYPACRGETSEDQIKKYQCPTCGRTFAQLVTLQDHQETHLELTARPKISCTLCGAHMLRRSYREHKRSYCPALKKEKPVCHLCGKQFNSLRYVAQHLAQKHGVEGQRN